MVQFETIEKERRDYGNFPGEKFVEVSRNKAIQDDGSENSFIQIATGYYNEDEPQYKKRFTVPTDDKAVEHIVEELPKMLEKEKNAQEE
ncbi:MAG: glutathionyl-hydroquinone reductase [Candidatus Nanohaloarchaea archaeon]|jgi:glutathionyl-hydroquinone reductase